MEVPPSPGNQYFKCNDSGLVMTEPEEKNSKITVALTCRLRTVSYFHSEKVEHRFQ